LLTIDGIIFALQRHGGISTYFKELIVRLARERAALQIVLYGSGGPALEPPAEVVRVARRLGEMHRRCKVSPRTLLFHSSYYRLPDRKTLPVVTTVHDFTYERTMHGPDKWLHSWQKFSAIRASSAIICVSEWTRRDLMAFLPDVPPERLHVVHNGVGEAFTPGLNGARGRVRWQPYVLFVGARAGYKNFAAAARAVARIADLRLVSIGGDALAAGEIELLERILPARYEHRESVSDAQLNELYNAAECLVYPSASEGFGIPILEAMKAGCPVVAVRCSSIPEVAGDAAVLVEAAEPDLLAAAIESTMNEPGREALRTKGFSRAAMFSWDKMFRETVALYEQVTQVSLLDSRPALSP
jgi:mannosyltransferase